MSKALRSGGTQPPSQKSDKKGEGNKMKSWVPPCTTPGCPGVKGGCELYHAPPAKQSSDGKPTSTRAPKASTAAPSDGEQKQREQQVCLKFQTDSCTAESCHRKHIKLSPEEADKLRAAVKASRKKGDGGGGAPPASPARVSALVASTASPPTEYTDSLLQQGSSLIAHATLAGIPGLVFIGVEEGS